MSRERSGHGEHVEWSHGVGRYAALMGRCLGDFLVGEQIGAGGHSIIFRARQETLEREVVLKIMRWSGSYDQDVTERFLREAQIASQLDHPYAAHIYAFGAEPDGLLWIAMELVRGSSLGDLLTAQGSLSLPRFVPLLEKICEVVYQAHQQGIVHRDIKPGNVMVLARAGKLLPKLLDLGIAHLVEKPTTVSATRRRAPTDRTFAAMSHAETDGGVPIPFGEQGDAGTGPVRATPSSSTSATSLGSPPYMAPEQWVAASRCGPRSDQYSLAIMAYEAIIGHLPFQRPTPTAYARAHLGDTVPPLGEGFPDALSKVLERALAKKPEQRYPDVLAFAQAFRAAAGLDGETEHRARLPASTRELLVARAPQSLADSVALLETTRDPVRALEASFQVVRVAVRLVGLYAIAALTQYPTGNEGHGDSIRVAFRRLRSRLLTARDWLMIAQTLTEPYAARPDIHPLPELVLLFHGAGTGAETGAETVVPGVEAEVDGAPDILDILAAVEECAQGDEPAAVIEAMTPALTRLLERLSFVCEYRMVVRHRGRDEICSGERRAVRRTVRVRGRRDDLEDSDVALIGPADELLLALSPLCRLRAPAPGTAAEIFLFDGRSRYGARMVSFPIGFEWHDSEFWRWYDAQRVEFAATGGDDEVDDGTDTRAPYRGLSAFSPDDADVYFGREREVHACVNRLRVEPLLVVVGPSGAGKSSFVQAGIIPSLPAGWRALTIRPGPTPLASLATALARAELDHGQVLESVDEIRAYLEDEPGALARLLCAHAERASEGVVLVVDQFEELVTLGSSSADQDYFAAALMAAARSGRSDAVASGGVGVRIILTLRDDFLLRVQTLSALREDLGPSLQLLATPPPDELERILVEPARRAGYEFENQELPREMVAAIADEPGALALLSFTASRLWDMRDRHFRKLRVSAYRALGGVGGALAQHAEECLESMPEDRRALVREVFRQLVTADGTRAVASREELFQVLGREDEGNAVLEALIGARLLVASEGEAGAGGDRIEVVHEALLSSWPRLVTWQRQDAESARLRDQLRTAARQWAARDRPRGFLWRGDALLEYRVWRARYQGSLTHDEDEFARASLSAEARGRRRRTGLLVSAFMILLAGLLVMLSLERQATNERARAQGYAAQSRDRLLDLYVEQGRLALLAGESERAFAYLSGALHDGADGHALRFMIARAAHALSDQIMVLPGHDGWVTAIAYSPDGSRLASAGEDRLVKVWDARTGALVWTLAGHEQFIGMLDFDRDGSRLVSASVDYTARVWNTATGTLEWTANHDHVVYWARFSHDGSKLATGSADSQAVLWDAATGRVLHRWPHDKAIITARFSRDDDYLVTASSRGMVQVSEVQSGTIVNSARVSDEVLMDLAMDDDGQVLVLADMSGHLYIRSRDGQDEFITVDAHDDRVTRVFLLRDGDRILSASEDDTARLWRVSTGEQIGVLEGHTAGLPDAQPSPDGERIMTASRDATMRLWDASTGDHLWTFIGHRDGILALSHDPFGDRVATASLDGTIRVWNARPSVHELELPPQESEIQQAAFSPDGASIATIRIDATNTRAVLQIWDRRGALMSVLENEVVSARDTKMHVAWHPDGKRVLVSGIARAVAWDLASGQRVAHYGAADQTILHAIYTADGEQAITAGDNGDIQVWDAQRETLVRTLTGHQDGVTWLDMDTRSQRLVSAGVDKTARVWNVESGAQLETWSTSPPQPLNSVRFGEEGRIIIGAAEDKTGTIWLRGTGNRSALEGHADAIPSAAISPDGHLVATGSEDGTIRIWDMDAAISLWSSPRRLARVRSVEFSPDGRHVLAAQGHTARLWRVDYEERGSQELDAFAACRTDFALTDGRIQRVDRAYTSCGE